MKEFDIVVDLKINIEWKLPPENQTETILRDMMQIGVDAQSKDLAKELKKQIENELKKRIPTNKGGKDD